jgi:hypothetical protein
VAIAGLAARCSRHRPPAGKGLNFPDVELSTNGMQHPIGHKSRDGAL